MIVPISVYVFIIGTALIIAAVCLGIIAGGRWLWGRVVDAWRRAELRRLARRYNYRKGNGKS